jgi:hypothetical protein
MSESSLQIERNEYAPGETLCGTVSFEAEPAYPIGSVEVAIYWITDGKGDSDRGEIYRRVFPQGEEKESLKFQVPLPVAPLSYQGILVKIRWFVEVKIRYERPDASLLLKIVEKLTAPVSHRQSFQLGNVKSPKAVST